MTKPKYINFVTEHAHTSYATNIHPSLYWDGVIMMVQKTCLYHPYMYIPYATSYRPLTTQAINGGNTILMTKPKYINFVNKLIVTYLLSV